jgi:hypothetical protein
MPFPASLTGASLWLHLESALSGVQLGTRRSTTRSIHAPALAIAAFAFLPLSYSAAAPGGDVSVKEEKLLSLPAGADIATLAIDADGSHIAYTVGAGSKAAVVLDGRPGEAYDKVERLGFVEGGRLLTYVASLDGASYYVYGSSRSGPWDEVRPPVFWNGPFSNPAAFIAKKGAAYSLVRDGVAGPSFDEISSVAVSTAGDSLAYVGRSGASYSVVWDGRRFDYPSKVDSLALAKFGRVLHIAWILHEKGAQSLVVDGVRGRAYDEIGSAMAYDAIGASKPLFGYEAKKDGAWRYVVGDAETPAFDQVELETLVLAPDGALLAYGGSTKEGWYVFRGGAREGPYADLYSPALMPDGKTVIYFAVDSSDRAFAVVDGVRSEGFDNNGLFGGLTGYNSRGEWAIAGMRDGHWYVFTKAGAGRAYDAVNQVAYGNDGILRVLSRSGGSRYVDFGDTRSGPYDDAEFLYIGSDGGFLGFEGTVSAILVRKGDRSSILFGPSTAGLYDRIIVNAPEKDGLFRYFGVKGRELWRGLAARK